MSDRSALSARARPGWSRAWLPHLGFGALLLALVPFYRPFDTTSASTCAVDPTGTTSCGGSTPTTAVDLGPITLDPFDTVVVGLIRPLAHPLVLGLAWLAALTLGVLVTRWWNRRGGSGGPVAHTAFLGAATLLAASVLRGLTGTLLDLGTWPERLSVVALVAVAGFAVVRASVLSRGALGVLVALSAVLAAVAVHKTGGLWLIAAVLLSVAVAERSTVPGVVVAVFAVTVVLADVNYVGRLFYRLGLDLGGTDSALFNGKDLLLPAAVLLVGGVALLLAPRVSPPGGRSG